ncbi:MAG TPA: efflux RND transporter periplasmic adaptor subunit [Smithellaceae bacterium]|nr:efflux RND transporter periplasmic adaptor subunit [Smithellaceae bacterium]HRS88671.1 efflux RND transporter periplasmic adaptor subunit [Smithellaceae bacterium]HRV27097.1 efflux RND transporter periplasmic adaptor subunit [Smithellaceae bacterium]
MKKIIIAAIILIIASIGFCTLIRHKNNQVKYVTETVGRGDIKAMVSATGTVNAVTTVLVGTQVSGTIKQLLVDFNSPVKKGQLLATIDPSTFEAQVQQAKANLLLAEANLEKARVAAQDAKTNLERNKTLFDRKFIAKIELDNSETAYLSSLAQLKASEAQVAHSRAALNYAQTNLRYTRIVSPVNGIVISRNIDVGQTVAASFQTPTLFTIAQDLTKMQINTSVDEADIGRIKKGQPVEFSVDSYPDITFKGNVSEVRNSPIIVQNVVTYDVIVKVDNPELKLKPGMTANVSIEVANKKDVLLIPSAALRINIQDSGSAPPRQRSPGVWILRANKPQRVAIETGISDNRFTEVLSGDISVGSSIIVEVNDPKKQAAAASSFRPPGYLR